MYNLIFGFGLMIATTVAPQGKWVGPANVESMVVQPNGSVYVELAMNTPNLGCQKNTSGWLELDSKSSQFQKQYAMLTSAHLSNRQVEIFVSGCGNYPRATTTKIH
jgi:hypothetical protein